MIIWLYQPQSLLEVNKSYNSTVWNGRYGEQYIKYHDQVYVVSCLHNKIKYPSPKKLSWYMHEKNLLFKLIIAIQSIINLRSKMFI